MKNQCPHPQCARLKPREQYACGPHWHMLPKPIQRAIWSGYRNAMIGWTAADRDARAHWKKVMDEEARAAADVSEEVEA